MNDLPTKNRIAVEGWEVIITLNRNRTVREAETADGRGYWHKGLAGTQLRTEEGRKILYQNQPHSETPMTDEELEEARELRDILKEAVRRVTVELERKKEIEEDMVRARREMERDTKKQQVKESIEEMEFGHVKKKNYGHHGHARKITQRFKIQHENGDTYTGDFSNLFDVGTRIRFDKREASEEKGASQDESSGEPVAHGKARGEGYTQAEKDVLEAVKVLGDVPTRIRM